MTTLKKKPGGLVKKKDAPIPCAHPEHDPPAHMVYEKGATYEYTCPACGKSVEFTIPLIMC